MGSNPILSAAAVVQPDAVTVILGAYALTTFGAVQIGPCTVTIEPMIKLELERIDALEVLGMTLAHLNDAEARNEVSPRVPLLIAIRDKLAAALREAS